MPGRCNQDCLCLLTSNCKISLKSRQLCVWRAMIFIHPENVTIVTSTCVSSDCLACSSSWRSFNHSFFSKLCHILWNENKCQYRTIKLSIHPFWRPILVLDLKEMAIISENNWNEIENIQMLPKFDDFCFLNKKYFINSFIFIPTWVTAKCQWS